MVDEARHKLPKPGEHGESGYQRERPPEEGPGKRIFEETSVLGQRRLQRAEERVLQDPEPVVAVGELGDSSVNLLVRPWCASGDYWPLRWDLTRKIKESLEDAGCSIPYLQTDVHMIAESKGDAA